MNSIFHNSHRNYFSIEIPTLNTSARRYLPDQVDVKRSLLYQIDDGDMLLDDVVRLFFLVFLHRIFSAFWWNFDIFQSKKSFFSIVFFLNLKNDVGWRHSGPISCGDGPPSWMGFVVSGHIFLNFFYKCNLRRSWALKVA